MSLNNFGLGFVFQGVDRVSGVALKVNHILTEVAKSSDTMSKKLRDPATGKMLGKQQIGKLFERDASMVSAGVVTMSAGVAGLRGAIGAANIAGAFEQGLAGISAIAKATDSEMRLARDSVIKAGMETQFSPTEALTGMQNLVTAGQTITESTKTLIPVLDLAAGSLGNLDVGGASEAIVGTLNSYGFAATKATEVTNQLLRITQLTNFSTKDFGSALAKAASNGAMFGTELDDVLITVGLLRNANIDASSAGTGFRESIRRVATMTAQQDKIMQAGVDVYDKTTGKMRSIVDITMDLTDATKDWTESKRNEMLNLVYGSRGLLAFNAIQRATFKTMKNGVLVTYEGREAVQRLRAEMAVSSGDINKVRKATEGFADQQVYLTRALTEGGKTAQEFREKLLDTYAGQKQILGGITDTLIVLVGEPLNKAFKPVVRWLAETFSKLAAIIESISPETKVLIGKVIVLSAVLMAVAGAVIAARFSFIAFNATMGMVGLSIKSVFMAFMKLNMWARIIAVGAYLIYTAYRQNLGGIADRVERLVTVLRLAFQGLQQAFSSGAFTGAVRAELNKAENSGIKAFVIRVYAIGMRLKAFFEGVAEGFGAAWKEVGPVVWEALSAVKDAILAVMSAFGVFQTNGDGLVKNNMNTWRQWGRMVGKSIALVILVIAKVIKFVAGFAQRHPTMVKTLMLGVFAWKALNIAIGVGVRAFYLVKQGVKMAIGAFNMLKKAFAVLRVLVATNPFLAIAAAIAIVAFLIYDNWDWIVTNVWEPFIGWITRTADMISNGLSRSWQSFKRGLAAGWKQIKKIVWDPFEGAIMWIVNLIGSVLKFTWDGLVGGFLVTWKSLKKYMWDPFMAAIDYVAEKLQWIWDQLPGLPDWLTGQTGLSNIIASAREKAANPARKADDSTIGGMFAQDFGVGGPAVSAQMAPLIARAKIEGSNMSATGELATQINAQAKKEGLSKADLMMILKANNDKPIVVQIDGSTVATAVSAHSEKNATMGFGSEEGFWDG